MTETPKPALTPDQLERSRQAFCALTAGGMPGAQAAEVADQIARTGVAHVAQFPTVAGALVSSYAGRQTEEQLKASDERFTAALFGANRPAPPAQRVQAAGTPDDDGWLARNLFGDQ